MILKVRVGYAMLLEVLKLSHAVAHFESRRRSVRERTCFALVLGINCSVI